MPSTIEWTDETWNPVTGCTRVSPGCDNCYMFALYPRLRAMGVPGYQDTPDTVRMLPERIQTPLKWRRPRRVFVNSCPTCSTPASSTSSLRTCSTRCGTRRSTSSKC